MEDLFRLNIGYLLGLFLFLIAVSLIHIITVRFIKNPLVRKIINGIYILILSVGIILGLISFTNQISVNDITRKIIDRSFTTKSQQENRSQVELS